MWSDSILTRIHKEPLFPSVEYESVAQSYSLSFMHSSDVQSTIPPFGGCMSNGWFKKNKTKTPLLEIFVKLISCTLCCDIYFSGYIDTCPFV